MNKKAKSVLPDVLWLIVCFALTAAILALIFDWRPGNENVYLHIHDTYIVMSSWLLIIPIFLLIIFMTYFILAALNRFTRIFQNLILFLSGFLIIILTIFINREIVIMGANINWTQYPPLSQMEDERSITLLPEMKMASDIILGIQVVMVLSMLLVAFKWGRNRQLIRPVI